MDKAVNTGLYHVFVFEGGSRSSKTYSLIQFFVVYAFQQRKPTRIVISRKKGTWLNATVWVDFCNILTELGLVEKRDYTKNKTLHQIGIGLTTFEFVGLDDVQKLHGLTVDIFWINEAMEASKDDFDQLEQRCSRFAVLDYNPSAEQHWIYDSVCTRKDCYFDHSTMLQNPFIPENSRRKILSYEPTEENFAQGTADERKWKIYGLGMRAALEGLVFNNVEIIDAIPEYIDKRAYGLDFGYSVDPSACVELGYFKNNLYLDEKFYKEGMLTRDIAAELGELERRRRLPIISESADPRLIDELKQYGLPISGVHKYPGSIEAGLDFMRGCKIFLTANSVNLKREFDNYTYAQDRYGNWLNIPVDDYNHGIDAARYICLELIVGNNKQPVDLQRVAAAIGR
jgi:phage terminase large subunit